MSRDNRKGILLMIAAVAAFAVQDGFSRHLAESYNTLMVVMIRYWVFAGFVIALALRRPEGIRAAVRSRRIGTHVIRATLLVAEVCIIVRGYTMIGLIESHAVFAICPLLIVAMSGPLLGEKLSWQRWAAVGVGLIGMLVVLNPGSGVFSWPALMPLASALLFAIYSILTRKTTRDEPAFPAFFWPAVIGAALMTAVGLPKWEAVRPDDWLYLFLYAIIAIGANWLLVKCYEAAEASSVQPFAYLHAAFATAIGMAFFGETLAPTVLAGAILIVAAGIYALWHEHKSIGPVAS